jgi:D-aminopeptidase
VGEPGRCRLRDLGVAIGVLPTGPLNAITDVPGVRVGHCTVSWGGPELPHGSGPARTGVTAVFPHAGDIWHERVVAGAFAANGVGEVIGISAIREWGVIETPVLLTNSQSAGAVYDATVRWMMARDPRTGIEDAVMPVVGECDDGLLNDLRGMHVGDEHVRTALDAAAEGPVAEGCVGAGTGMTCFDFKAGIGTSSRVTRHASRRRTGRRTPSACWRSPTSGRATGSPSPACPSAPRSPTSCRSRTARDPASSCSPPTRR